MLGIVFVVIATVAVAGMLRGRRLLDLDQQIRARVRTKFIRSA